MIRVHITNTDIEGYYEGCSCCSVTASASINDVRSLIKKLDKQKQKLSLLLEVMETYSRDEIIRWYGIFEQLRYENSAVECGEKYKKDKSIQGTFYSDSFKNLEEHKKAVARLEKEYKKLPSEFRKYIKMEAE